MKRLLEAGTILEAGPTLDEPGGLVTLKARDLGEAEAIMAADPPVILKMFVGEVHSWSDYFHSQASLPAPAATTR